MSRLLLRLWVLIIFAIIPFTGQLAAQTTATAETTFYGYCYSGSPTGPVKFSLSSPDEMTTIAANATYFAHAGENVDGTWYAYMYSSSGPYSYSQINLANGALATIGLVSGYGAYLDSDYVADMAYSYAETKLYTLKNTSGNVLTTASISTSRGKHTALGAITGTAAKLITLACDYGGNLYAIGDDAKLYEIDPVLLEADEVGELDITGFEFTVRQWMGFDHNSGILYWMAESGKLYTINKATGKATLCSDMSALGRKVTGLFTLLEKPATGDVPLMVQNLTATAGANGALTLSLSWTNPTKTFIGDNITALTAVKVYRDNVLYDTYTTNLTTGATVTWTDTNPTNGMHTYKAVPVNAEGDGAASSVTIHTGTDTPLPITDLVLEKDENGRPKLTWTAPTTGANGGWIGTLTYDVVRNPGTVSLATDISATTYTDMSELELGKYSYAVTAKNATGTATAVSTATIMLGSPLSVPYSGQFSDAAYFDLWTIIDANADMYKWARTGSDMYVTSSYSITADDWLISPPLALTQGQKYRIRWYERTSVASGNDAVYEITAGKGETAESQTLIDEFTITGNVNSEHMVVFTPSETAAYNFGWHYITPSRGANLYVTNIEVTVLAAIDIKANSFTGPVNLSEGEISTFTTEFINYGEQDIASFTVTLTDDLDNTIATKTYSETLLAGDKVEITLDWTPTIAQMGKRTITVSASAAGDGALENNSLSMDVDVYAFGTAISNIGDTNTTAQNLTPINLAMKNSFSQNIFLVDEVKNSGMIESITFYTEFTEAAASSPMKVYLATTDRTAVPTGTTSSWIRTYGDLAFEGTVEFPAGTAASLGAVTIDLDKPFYYDGTQNLLVTTQRENGPVTYTATSVKFSQALTGGNKYGRMAYWSHNTSDFTIGSMGASAAGYHPRVKLVFNTNGNELSGTVVSGIGAAANVTVKVLDTEYEALTDVDGKYEFEFIPADDYQVSFIKTGYTPVTKNISISKEAPAVLDATIEGSNLVSMSGNVINASGDPVKDANVVLTIDNEERRAITDDNGEFTFDELYADRIYDLYIFRPGYKAYDDEVEVGVENMLLEDILMEQCSGNGVGSLLATVNEPAWYDITLTWTAAQPGVDDTVVGHRIYRNGEIYKEVGLVYTYIDTALPVGAYTYAVTTVWSNGCESGRVMSGEVEVVLHECDDPLTEFPFGEGFESAEFASCWEQEFISGAYEWRFVTDGANGPGSGSGPVNTPHSGQYNLRLYGTGGNATRLIMPAMDISGLSNPLLTFWFAQPNWMSSQDNLKIYYKSGFNGEWKLLFDANNEPVREWKEMFVELPDASDYYRIAFEGTVRMGYGVVLDDVRIISDLCHPVTNLSYTQLLEKEVLLSWDAPNALYYRSYNVLRDGVVIAENIEETEYLDTNVALGTYEYGVIVNYDKADCTESAEETITVNVIGKCDPISELSADLSTASSVDLLWEAPNATNIALYNVYRDGTLIGTASNTSYTDDGFEEGTIVDYCITAVYTGKDCAESDEVCTSVNTECASVSNLQINLEHNNKATLTWEGDGELASFQIFKNGDAITTQRELQYIDRGLPAGEEFEYTVVAIYDQGCESNPVSKAIATECMDVIELDVVLDPQEENCIAELNWKIPGDYDVADGIVYDNGAYVDEIGTGPDGMDVAHVIKDDRVEVWRRLIQKFADDFVLTKDTYIEEVTFYTWADISEYVNLDMDLTEHWDEIAAGIVVGVYVTIYDGNPATGGTLLWGSDGDPESYGPDPDNNIIKSCKFAYALTEEGYHIFTVTATIETLLPAGEYWIGFNTDSDPENTWYIGGAFAYHVPGVEGNAHVLKTSMDGPGGGWYPATTQDGMAMAMPFTMKGYTIPDLYNIYRDDELIEENYEGNTYTDIVERGEHKWSVAHVCFDEETAIIDVTDNCDGVGIIELANMNELMVYPNPAQDYVMFSGVDIQRISIYDINGRFIESLDFSNGREPRITVSQYPAGTYLFVVKDNTGQSITKRVIIK